MDEVTERHFRRNLALLAIDMTSFSVGLTFLGPATVLPGLVRALGGSPVAVGALGVIQSGGWYLPQLFGGRQVAHRPLVKGYLVLMACISRIILALTVPALLLFAVRAPTLALAIFLVAYGGFTFTDALGGVGWFTVLAKTVPLDRRGRVMGSIQSVSSLVAIGAGIVVRAILARPDPFPANYVLLIVLATVLTSVSPLAFWFVREPRSVVESEERPGWREYLSRLAAILGRDARFTWLIITGWIAALADMGGAFYVLFAADRLHVKPEMIGLFISANVVGTLVSGVLLGHLGDRKGSATVIAVSMALRCVCPGLVLVTPRLAGLHPWMAPGLLLLIFGGLGMVGGAYMIGFTNYMLEIAPEGERSLYISLAQTLGAVVMFAPLAAGWLVEAASYEALYGVALAMALVGMAVSLRVPRGAGVQPRLREAGS